MRNASSRLRLWSKDLRYHPSHWPKPVRDVTSAGAAAIGNGPIRPEGLLAYPGLRHVHARCVETLRGCEMQTQVPLTFRGEDENVVLIHRGYVIGALAEGQVQGYVAQIEQGVLQKADLEE